MDDPHNRELELQFARLWDELQDAKRLLYEMTRITTERLDLMQRRVDALEKPPIERETKEDPPCQEAVSTANCPAASLPSKNAPAI